jgi:hypothetical protein
MSNGYQPVIELFEDPCFVGMAVPLTESVSNFRRINFDVSSVKVNSGIWAVYSEPAHQGIHSIVYPGSSYADVSEIKWAELPGGGEYGSLKISSVKLLKGEIILYEGNDFKGRSLPLTKSTPNLGIFSFNKKASSVRIISGTWQLYQNYNFAGASFTCSGSKYSPIPNIPPNTLSSVRYIPEA